MTTTQAAAEIHNTMIDLNHRKITVEAARDRMKAVKDAIGEMEYERAKWAAVAHQSR